MNVVERGVGVSVENLRMAPRWPAAATPSPQSSTHRPRRKISVMTIHVFMLNPQCSCLRIGAGPRFSLIHLSDPAALLPPAESRTMRRNLDINGENRYFSGLPFDPVRRRTEHRPSQHWQCGRQGAKRFFVATLFFQRSAQELRKEATEGTEHTEQKRKRGGGLLSLASCAPVGFFTSASPFPR